MVPSKNRAETDSVASQERGITGSLHTTTYRTGSWKGDELRVGGVYLQHAREVGDKARGGNEVDTMRTKVLTRR